MFRTTFEQLDSISIIVVLAVCLISAITDLRRFKVYNSVTIPFFLAGLLYNTVTAGFEGLKLAGVGAACGTCLLFFVFVYGKAGAGDVKLLAGIGAWLGPRLVFEIFLISAIAGALIAVIAMICTNSVRETCWRFVTLLLQVLVRSGSGRGQGETVQEVVQRGDRRARVIPFAAALFLGTSVIFVQACCLTRSEEAVHRSTRTDSQQQHSEVHSASCAGNELVRQVV